jgi:hypothetical protein
MLELGKAAWYTIAEPLVAFLGNLLENEASWPLWLQPRCDAAEGVEEETEEVIPSYHHHRILNSFRDLYTVLLYAAKRFL